MRACGGGVRFAVSWWGPTSTSRYQLEVVHWNPQTQTRQLNFSCDLKHALKQIKITSLKRKLLLAVVQLRKSTFDKPSRIKGKPSWTDYEQTLVKPLVLASFGKTMGSERGALAVQSRHSTSSERSYSGQVDFLECQRCPADTGQNYLSGHIGVQLKEIPCRSDLA